MSTDVLLVLTHLPDRVAAERLARSLIDQRLAACVNIGAAVTSLYHWRGQVEMVEEIPLAVKTTRAVYPRLEAAMRALHPYELPEIVAVTVEQGLSEYLAWVDTETRSSAPGTKG
jgi:periplasmic divalent cation tolerance protein